MCVCVYCERPGHLRGFLYGCRFSDELVQRVRGEIRSNLSARHVPHLILETTDIPVSVCSGRRASECVQW